MFKNIRKNRSTHAALHHPPINYFFCSLTNLAAVFLVSIEDQTEGLTALMLFCKTISLSFEIIIDSVLTAAVSRVLFSSTSPIKARYFLAIDSQSATFSIRVVFPKLSCDPSGLRWTTPTVTESVNGFD